VNGRDDDARRAEEDAEFLSIVDSYGDRPAFPDPPREHPDPVDDTGPVIEEPAEFAPTWDDEGGYVPPPPPPVPRPHGIRAAAWFGLFGVPVLVLASIVLSISLPSPVTLLLLGWFVGGFGYLVATMQGPDDPDSGWDDGAVV
jgi:hypothetical protein